LSPITALTSLTPVSQGLLPAVLELNSLTQALPQSITGNMPQVVGKLALLLMDSMPQMAMSLPIIFNN